MFTVKHTQHGIENLYAAKGVTQRNDGVEIILSDGGVKIFAGKPLRPGTGGSMYQTIYVMNDHGKTVATYNLDGGAGQLSQSAAAVIDYANSVANSLSAI